MTDFTSTPFTKQFQKDCAALAKAMDSGAGLSFSALTCPSCGAPHKFHAEPPKQCNHCGVRFKISPPSS